MTAEEFTERMLERHREDIPKDNIEAFKYGVFLTTTIAQVVAIKKRAIKKKLN